MNNKGLLEKARKYETENSRKADPFRPGFHVTGGIGWINDPNGFSVYKGEYHLFHQYHPYSTEWGPMHWGHLKSKDLIKWERLPVALAPDSDFDKDGCYSGTAIETPDHKHLIIYTGVVKEDAGDGTIKEIQHQCVAVGDGTDYEKAESNPVIGINDIPKGAFINDFRDPKIWLEDDEYYVLSANRGADGSGSLLLYKSKDGINWSFVKVFKECNYRYGIMWECPDFFSLGDKQVLVISPCDMEAEGLEFHAGHGVIAMCGKYDKEKKAFSEDWVQAVDYGTDFYAPETVKAPDGRIIMVGWMRNWATTALKEELSPIFGAMTLPRELSIRNGRMIINPVREIEKYRTNHFKYENVVVKNAVSLEGLRGRSFDMTVSVKPHGENDYSFFSIKLAKDNRHHADITYRPHENTVTIDRTQASKRTDTIQSRTFKVADKEGLIKLRIIMDRESIELFVNDGEQVATFITYNDINAEEIEFEADAQVFLTIDKYDIDVNI